ncbi:hypothetical protein [Paraburkholderia sp. J67]|uniref:hypothetical protein n=1 Tax=Paraburkholderia sp. J67 TaxID=2805435 RepID=UPI002ABDB1DF|nr:hypothetical protein [Paraburkholderia sp. J67]
MTRAYGGLRRSEADAASVVVRGIAIAVLVLHSAANAYAVQSAANPKAGDSHKSTPVHSPRKRVASTSPPKRPHASRHVKKKNRQPDVFYHWSSKQLMLGGVDPSGRDSHAGYPGQAHDGHEDATSGRAAASGQALRTPHEN